jgi:hypothetical protein
MSGKTTSSALGPEKNRNCQDVLFRTHDWWTGPWFPQGKKPARDWVGRARVEEDGS